MCFDSDFRVIMAVPTDCVFEPLAGRGYPQVPHGMWEQLPPTTLTTAAWLVPLAKRAHRPLPPAQEACALAVCQTPGWVHPSEPLAGAFPHVTWEHGLII